MVRIMPQFHVRRSGILRGLERHSSPAVVILLEIGRIQGPYHKPQTAPFQYLSRCEIERTEMIEIYLAGLHEVFLL